MITSLGLGQKEGDCVYYKDNRNGHKRVHGLKFQSIVIPNGLISHLYGPIERRRHDAGMLRESNVLAQMANHMISPNGHIFSAKCMISFQRQPRKYSRRAGG
jgi:hypothetical protein